MLNVISLGAGVQSSTMALMAAHGEITPMPDCCVFADTKNEPAAVYGWLDWLEKQLPFPVYRVTKGDLGLDETVIKKSKKNVGNIYRMSSVPAYTLSPDGHKGMLPRKCTKDYKILPIIRKIRSVARIPRGCKTIQVITWLGISTDEASRMKPMMETKRINGKPVKVPHSWIENRWPLIEMGMSRQDCLDWMVSHGYPKPPRSACVFCPYHNNYEWLNLKNNYPDEFSTAVEQERAMQKATDAGNVSTGKPFLHNSRVPLDQVDFSTDEDRGQLNMFNNECEGMCGV